GLALRTVARMAAYLVEHEPRPKARIQPRPQGGRGAGCGPDEAPQATPAPRPSFRRPADRPELRAVGGRFRADLVVAAGLAFFVLGLGFSAVNRLRQQSDEVACPNNLRTLHVGLSAYADTHARGLPEWGVAAYRPAGTSPAPHGEAGRSPPGFPPPRPAGRRPSEPGAAPAPVPYTYTLGYRGPNGELLGLCRAEPGGENDLLPIAADSPAADAVPCQGPVSPPGRGQFVLYVGGQVRFATTAQAGLNGDHIYQNFNGQVAAGLERSDTVLGRAGDRP